MDGSRVLRRTAILGFHGEADEFDRENSLLDSECWKEDLGNGKVV